MAECLSERLVTTRKDHRCHGCSVKINKKSKDILLSTCVDDGIYNLYYCTKCQIHMKEKCSKCNECYELEMATNGYILECVNEQR